MYLSAKPIIYTRESVKSDKNGGEMEMWTNLY